MKNRCLNPRSDGYKRYGERGITVCHEWQKNFTAFRDWAETNGYAEHLTLDRIDNDGPYSPENCRWATPKEQSRNSRQNRILTIYGEQMALAKAADRYGISQALLHQRLKDGWSVEEAVSTPKTRPGDNRKSLAQTA